MLIAAIRLKRGLIANGIFIGSADLGADWSAVIAAGACRWLAVHARYQQRPEEGERLRPDHSCGLGGYRGPITGAGTEEDEHGEVGSKGK